MSSLPARRDDNLRAAPNAASEAAAARAAALDPVRRGEVPLSSLDALIAVDEYVGRIRLSAAVRAVPGWGPKRTEKVCARAGIEPHRTLRWAFENRYEQLEQLFKWVEADEDSEPWLPDDVPPRWPYAYRPARQG